jgi:hypothetical protein
MYTKSWSENLKGTDHHRHGWEHSIGMNLRGMGWEGVNWIRLAQDRNLWRAVVNTVMEPSDYMKGGELLD